MLYKKQKLSNVRLRLWNTLNFDLQLFQQRLSESIRHLQISLNEPYFPQIFHNLCFSFLLGFTTVPKEIENNAYAKFWGENKVRYRRCAGGEQVIRIHSTMGNFTTKNYQIFQQSKRLGRFRTFYGTDDCEVITKLQGFLNYKHGLSLTSRGFEDRITQRLSTLLKLLRMGTRFECRDFWDRSGGNALVMIGCWYSRKPLANHR